MFSIGSPGPQMNIEEINYTMLALVEGKLTPAEWSAWWQLHGAEVEKLLSRGEFLRIKPKKWADPQPVWRAIFCSQEGAFHYLLSRQIPFHASSVYRDKWNKEFDGFCKKEDRECKEKTKELKDLFPLLFKQYPKFAATLKYTYGTGDTIAPGATDEDVKQWEREFAITLPEDIKAFFQICASLRLEGIQLEIGSIHSLRINGKSWWVLGEFWKEADGDLLLFQQANAMAPTAIYYYSHDTNKISKLANSMPELLEKKMAWYNRQ